MGVSRQRHIPAALPVGKITSTHRPGGWYGPGIGLEVCEKPRPAWVRFPNSPAPNVVAIPITLSRPPHLQLLLPNVFFPLEISNTT